MIELPLVFVAGLLGSAHCIGMCGPLAVTLGAGAGGLRRNLHRQVVYSAGRIFTYAFCGGAAGFAGVWIARQAPALVASQAWLAIAAGVVLVFMGLGAAGVLPRLASHALGRMPCSAAAGLKTFLTAPGWSNVFLAGVGTGFIPCGLVYAFLLKAGSTGSLWLGAATMALFGLGTVPLMVLAGVGGSLLSLRARAAAYRIAAWCVVVAGTMTVARGAWQLQPTDDGAAAACPFCVE